MTASSTATARLLLLALVLGDALAVIVFAAMGQLASAVVAAGALAVLATAIALYAMLRVVVLGECTEDGPLSAARRRELMEEKVFLLARIRELEFDHAMRKISEADHREQVVAARDRALEVMRDLEGASGVRSLIERELAERLALRKIAGDGAPAVAPDHGDGAAYRACPGCRAQVPEHGQLCPACGASLSKETVS